MSSGDTCSAAALEVPEVYHTKGGFVLEGGCMYSYGFFYFLCQVTELVFTEGLEEVIVLRFHDRCF
jgi:hypothetical protein